MQLTDLIWAAQELEQLGLHSHHLEVLSEGVRIVMVREVDGSLLTISSQLSWKELDLFRGGAREVLGITISGMHERLAGAEPGR